LWARGVQPKVLRKGKKRTQLSNLDGHLRGGWTRYAEQKKKKCLNVMRQIVQSTKEKEKKGGDRVTRRYKLGKDGEVLVEFERRQPVYEEKKGPMRGDAGSGSLYNYIPRKIYG